ncbi:MAG: serpin family protein [Clostridia bacterium]|nr:serpin family protein [Clostridia bacterium]
MKKLIVISIMIAVVALEGCAGKSPVAPSQPAVTASVELSAGYGRLSTDPGQIDSDLVNRAAWEVFGKVSQADQDNQLFSPLSVAYCLGMLANGMRGQTKAQFEALYGEVATLNRALYALAKTFEAGDGFKVELADSIWINEASGLVADPAFLQANADWYAAQVYSSAFDAGTRDDINAWVSKHTDGMIPKLLDDPPSKDTVMYLINTLLFDCQWLEEYQDSQVRDREFTNYDGSKSTVKMMYSSESSYLADSQAQGFVKLYKGGYRFVGLLPNEGVDVYEYARSMTNAKWQALWNSRDGYEVSAGIPEFEYDTSMNLVPVMQALGLTDMFNADLADLHGIGSIPTEVDYNLYVSLMLQKAKIQVTPKGTKAAAATVIGIEKATSVGPSMHKTVILDRPFVYLITDRAGNILFVGVVSKL